jgi:uncharacterized membrane protein
MRTPASIFKHPIHPMLIVFPIGLWIFSLACDLIRLAGATADAWFTVAFFSMIGGLIGALCASVPGFIDLLFYKGGAPPVKKIALTHMAINLTAVVLYAINIWLRASGPTNLGTSLSAPVVLSIIGVALLVVSGWLGGQMTTASASKGANDASVTCGDGMYRPRGQRRATRSEHQRENSNERHALNKASRSCIG